MKLWPWVGLAAALVCLSGAAGAATYAYRNDTFSYDTPPGSAPSVTWHASGAAPGCTDYENGDDDWADIAFSSGFSFTFGGTAYSGVRVYSNGILAFGNDVSGFHRDYTPAALPITTSAGGAPPGCPNAVPVNLMIPYWIDIVAGTANGTSGASVKYELLGTAPNRRFVISWVNVKLYNSTTRYNFQVALYESAAGTNGNFRFQYTSGSSNGANATVGVQLSTTDYTQYSYNQQFIDTTNGTAILWYPANQLATKTAEYRFDESIWLGTAGEIKDTSGNSRDASRAGAAASSATGKICRGASIPNNTSNATIDAVATPLTLSATGSADFWYRSNSAWNASDAMLFDATAVANRPFFLMKRSNGALRFSVSDSSGTRVTAETTARTFAANTWHHIGVTWNIRGGANLSQLQIFIDGVLVVSGRGTTNGTLAAVSSLYIGDNRTSGVTPTNGSGNSANGLIDEFYAYGIDVSGPQIQADMDLTRATCTALDHFHIIHNGTADCGVANVTIEAHDLNHALFSLAGTTMSVATNTAHGSWSAVTAINPVNNTSGGTATYTFANENRVIFALTNSSSETVNINVNSGSITEHSYVAATCTSPDYTFGTVCDADLVFGVCVSGFECIATGRTYNNLVSSPSARNPLLTQLANSTFSFDVVALDPSGNRVTSYASDANKTVTVALVDGSTADVCPARPMRETASLTFTKATQATDQGRKAVSFTVSQAYPNLLCRVTDANYATSVVGCSSDRFAIRPQSFSLDAYLLAPLPSPLPSPLPKTLAAGHDFTIIADSGVTAGYDGRPIVDLTRLRDHLDNATTNLTDIDPIEHADLNPAQVEFAAGDGAKAAGVFQYHDVGTLKFLDHAVTDAGFAAIDAPNDCVATGTVDEVTSNVAASDGRFGCTIGSEKKDVMRFYPDHFTYEATLTAACGNSFTYMDQPKLGIDLVLSARSLDGSVTTRYTDGYACPDLPTSSCVGTFSITAENNGTAVPLGRLVPAPSGYVWSSGSYTVIQPATTFTRNAAPDGPLEKFALKANILSEPDGVAISGDSLSNETKIRFGRLRLSNVYGYVPPLQMPVEAQYWSGNSWVKNGDDNCTALVDANLPLSPGATTWTRTAPGPGPLSGGGGTITINPTSAGSISVCADLGDDHGVACSGTGAALPWLQSKWPGGANHNNDPSATATFKVFKSEGKRGVYNREMY